MRILRVSLHQIKAMFGGPLAAVALVVALLLAFSAVSGALDSARADAVRLVVLDQDNTAESQALTAALLDNPSLNIIIGADEASARNMLALGRAEGLLVIGAGYQAAVVADQDKLMLRYVSAPISASGEAVREIVSGSAIAARSKVRAQHRAELALEELTPAQQETFATLLNESFTETYTIGTIGGTDSGAATGGGGRGVFYALSARYEGFVAFGMLLCMLSLSAFFSRDTTRRVQLRMRALPHGALLAFWSDALALFLPGVGMALIALLARGGATLLQAEMLLTYAVNLTGLCLLLSRAGGVGGRVDVLSVFVALLTGLAGGCFADFAALSPALRLVSLFTPQGLLLAGLSGDQYTVWYWLALLLSGVAMLALSYRAAIKQCVGKRQTKKKGLSPSLSE